MTALLSNPLDDPRTPVFTVFTATHNRAHTLDRVYKSLREQTFRSFEWVIVDDGSTDGTLSLVQSWCAEADFEIKYIRQSKGGKHVAFNRGVTAASGRFFLSIDSDDSCVPDALERLHLIWMSIPDDRRPFFTGVSVLCKDQTGKVIGSRFPNEVLDSDSLEIRYRYKVKGDKWGFHRIEVIRHFPFPEVAAVNFVPEGIVWSRIARKYKTRFANEVLQICSRGVDQLTRRDVRQPAADTALALWHKEILNTELDYFRYHPASFLRSAVHYSRFSLNAGVTMREQLRGLGSALATALYACAAPLGAALHLYDMLRQRKSRMEQ